ncbi:MAG: type II toxin-antitoxin system Phd/YefM family antitoxin [Burkholderiales bacterium]|nr:type II toxin-antitoxin system Phd/YefM family antitoxin [Burkholderiales bacterium]
MNSTRQVNVHEAKTHFSQLLEEVGAGAEIVIAKAGRPVARLVPLEPRRPVRQPGYLKGKLDVPDDFDAPLPDAIVEGFAGAP